MRMPKTKAHRWLNWVFEFLEDKPVGYRFTTDELYQWLKTPRRHPRGYSVRTGKIVPHSATVRQTIRMSGSHLPMKEGPNNIWTKTLEQCCSICKSFGETRKFSSSKLLVQLCDRCMTEFAVERI